MCTCVRVCVSVYMYNPKAFRLYLIIFYVLVLMGTCYKQEAVFTEHKVYSLAAWYNFEHFFSDTCVFIGTISDWTHKILSSSYYSDIYKFWRFMWFLNLPGSKFPNQDENSIINRNSVANTTDIFRINFFKIYFEFYSST